MHVMSAVNDPLSVPANKNIISLKKSYPSYKYLSSNILVHLKDIFSKSSNNENTIFKIVRKKKYF